MSSIIESHPFPDNDIPEKNRISIDDIPHHLLTSNMSIQMYPHITSSMCCYLAGSNLLSWSDTYECLYVWCCEKMIPNMVFIWSKERYKHITLTDCNWKLKYPLPSNFRELLNSEYGIGFTVGIYRSLRETLLAYPMVDSFQMYVGRSSENEKAHLSKFIPSFNFDNITAIDVIRERNLNVFAHSALNTNLANPTLLTGNIKYISNILKYCTAHGMKGVVFHVGTNKSVTLEDARNSIINSIVNGIRGAMFRPDQTGTAMFLLETSAGEKNELFSNIYEFIQFCQYIKSIPDIAPFFGICVDTCHVFQSGYIPYQYLKEFLQYLPVSLIHFNDSKNRCNGRVDEHSAPGEGLCPWIYLMKVAQLSKAMSIPMVYEC